jgi:type II secretory ATPase GspE/PulE/Tfp pilus assembly ATPase PilB-like protein
MENAEKPCAQCPERPSLFGLLRETAIGAGATPEAVEEFLREQQPGLPGSLISRFLDKNLCEENDFLRLLALRIGWEWREELPEAQSLPQNVLPARLALKHLVLPLKIEEGTLTLATFDPFSHAARSILAQQLSFPLRHELTSRTNLIATLRALYGVGAETLEQLVEGREVDSGGDAQEEVNVIDEDDAEASVMKFVNQIIREAIKQRATDIHIEPIGDQLTIRYRIDGMLRETPVPANIRLLRDSVISRIKIMSSLDIAEKRLPQDGRINLEFAGQAIDVRVATIPSVSGETISLRLLGQEHFDFPRLGLDAKSEAAIRELIAMPNGIILVTGPTGCGKSTSLYTFLSALNTKERRIVTIEDPVEHKLPGVVQIAVRSEIGLTFARALRSILRGDPNVIMVGEMRDFETAEIAIRAALTGHLVFSTLHTNDSVGGITRLLDMGIEPFLVGSAVRVFIAQRLVRKICRHCRQPDDGGRQYLEKHGITIPPDALVYKPRGCKVCHGSGYSGRTALFEICRITPAMQELIQNKAPAVAMKRLAMEEGMVPLRQQGWKRVFDGTTSVEEVLRVTAAEMSLADE